MEAIRDRILQEKARSDIHMELFDRQVQLEKKKHAERLLHLKQVLRKKIQTEVRWVSSEEYFEGELWLPGRLNYHEFVLSDFPPCKCKRTSEEHEAMPDKEYWMHRREVNRYRRMRMNMKAKRLLGEHTCPWKLMGTTI